MEKMRRLVAGIGRGFISSGVLVLLFVVYELYGTGIAEARSQKDLQEKFAHLVPPTTVPGVVPVTVPAVPVDSPPPPAGAAVAMIKIPKLDLVKAVIEGVDPNDLKKGPGHYEGTPMPGEPGNAAIAGHRTTYGAPFFRVDELVAGDPIFVTTRAGVFTYEVSGKDIVAPDKDEVLKNTDDNRLTLTTCHPRFSASQRLIVTAQLKGQPVAAAAPAGAVGGLGSSGEGEGGGKPAAATPEAPTTGITNKPAGNRSPRTATTTTEGAGNPTPTTVASPADGTINRPGRPVSANRVSGGRTGRGPVVTWGIITAMVALLIWALGRKWRKWLVYTMGAPVFLVVLFFFFENVSALLPANV